MQRELVVPGKPIEASEAFGALTGVLQGPEGLASMRRLMPGIAEAL